MSKDTIKHFLLVYNHALGRLIEVQEFGTDSHAALAAYSATERAHRDQSEIDIVLVGSDSLETVRATHANYFESSEVVSKYLVGLL